MLFPGSIVALHPSEDDPRACKNMRRPKSASTYVAIPIVQVSVALMSLSLLFRWCGFYVDIPIVQVSVALMSISPLIRGG